MKINVLEEINCLDFLKGIGFSRNVIPKIKYNLYNNGIKVKLIDTLKKGYLEIILDSYESDIIPINEPLDIVYEDDYILIVNKPNDLCIMPNRGYLTNNLSSRIINYYNTKGIKSTAHILTRLDRATRGLVFIIKYKELCNLFNKIDKRYYAVLEGIVDSKIVEVPIKKGNDGIKRIVDINGDYSKTIFNMVKQNKNTLMDVELITGRTHQIRVHSNYLNHPIVGDSLYGSGNDLMLQCYKLSFFHPFLNEFVEIEIKLDNDLIKNI